MPKKRYPGDYTFAMFAKDIFLTFLAVISILLLYLDLSNELSLQQTQTIVYADVIISTLFLMDFVNSYIKSKNKSRFAQTQWWELPASIPLGLEYFRVLRTFQFLRLIRILQVARLVRGASKFQRMLDNVQDFTEEVRLVYIINILGVIVLSGALGFHYAEADINPTVNTYLDSAWWSLSSVASLGAGHIYPITDAGKIVGMILVLAGMGVVSAFAGLVASYLVRHSASPDNSQDGQK